MVSGPPRAPSALSGHRPCPGMAEWMDSPLGTQAWPRQGDTTHLLHTMAMTTTAMRKTRPAAEEPMMSGSFSWMLVWYSAGEEAQRTGLSLARGVITPCIPTALGLLGALDSLSLWTSIGWRTGCYTLTSNLGQIHKLLRHSTSHP